MSMSSDRPSGRPLRARTRTHRCARAARRTDSLTHLGIEVVAHRLRTLGHPLRLRILRALDARHATVDQLAAELGASPSAVAAHVRLLSGCGVVFRTDDSGAATYALADWPSLWLVEQLAHRLALQAADHGNAESITCRRTR
jgi:DNA-binding transcriptional ArsR family regulator